MQRLKISKKGLAKKQKEPRLFKPGKNLPTCRKPEFIKAVFFAIPLFLVINNLKND